jgi:hypothetical protein
MAARELSPRTEDANGTTFFHASKTDYLTSLVSGGAPLNNSAYFIGSYIMPTRGTDSEYMLGNPDKIAISDSMYYYPIAYLWVGLMTIVVSFLSLFGGV